MLGSRGCRYTSFTKISLKAAERVAKVVPGQVPRMLGLQHVEVLRDGEAVDCEASQRRPCFMYRDGKIPKESCWNKR